MYPPVIKNPSLKLGGPTPIGGCLPTPKPAPASHNYTPQLQILLLCLGNQTLVPPPPPQHCHWIPELKNTMIADLLVAKATLEIAGHGHERVSL